jgi:hypothetical protein
VSSDTSLAVIIIVYLFITSFTIIKSLTTSKKKQIIVSDGRS